MGKVSWTQEAQRWLEDIYTFIAIDDPDAALQVVSGIYERTQTLLDFPKAGYRYQLAQRDVRILLYGHYRIAYLELEDGNVDILGVFHGALDIEKYSL